MSAKLIRFRYATRCATCGSQLEAGSQGGWDRNERRARCVPCLVNRASGVEIDRGVAGASATREADRRRERRETRVHERYGPFAAAVMAFSEEPQSTEAWEDGARGEQKLGAMLDLLRDEGMAVLHDRRVPGSLANIDHLVVSHAGVFVIDAKNYQGRVERRSNGWFSSGARLLVGGRDRSAVLAKMERQAAAVRAALGSSTVPMTQVICFLTSDWSLFARPLRFGDVHVLWPRALGKLVRSEGPVDATTIVELERRLALALPSAR
jgi:hypothetical protein